MDDLLLLFENYGNAVFSTEIIISDSLNGVKDVIIKDIDGDNKLDIVAIASVGDKVCWYKNLGGVVFSGEKIISSLMDGPLSIDIGDVDNDNDLDVLVSAFDGDIVWFKNDGVGNFSPAVMVASISNPRSITAADINGDSKLDVIVASFAEDKIIWYNNLGNNSFQVGGLLSDSFEGVGCVSAADVDDDGDVDIIAASQRNGNPVDEHKITWFANDGSGNFASEILISPVGGSSMFNLDLDNDGDIDLIVSETSSQTISVFSNYVLNSTKINGRLYYDINQNGINDSIDIGLPSIGVFSNPNSDFFLYSSKWKIYYEHK